MQNKTLYCSFEKKIRVINNNYKFYFTRPLHFGHFIIILNRYYVLFQSTNVKKILQMKEIIQFNV